MLRPLLISMALVALVPPQEPQKSLWQQIFGGPPTGRNGYEEYVQAAEMLDKPPLRDLIDRAASANDSRRSYLAARREVLSKGKAVLDLVRRGLTKDVFDPRPTGDMRSLFSELKLFQRITQLFQMESYVRFADGDTTAGTRALIDGIDFSRRTSQRMIVSFLMSVELQSSVLSEAGDRLPHLSQAAAATLGAAARRWLSEPEPIVRAIRSEMVFAFWTIDSALADPSVMKGFVKEEELMKLNSLATLPSPNKAQIVRELKTKIRRDFDEMASVVERPEKDWRHVGAIARSGDNPADVLYHLFRPISYGSLTDAARLRTQLRLLALHCSLIQHRWETNQLPGRLQDFAEENLRIDPLSGKPFVYRVLGDGRYELYSEGSDATGRIDLRYRRKLGPSQPEPEPPKT